MAGMDAEDESYKPRLLLSYCNLLLQVSVACEGCYMKSLICSVYLVLCFC